MRKLDTESLIFYAREAHSTWSGFKEKRTLLRLLSRHLLGKGKLREPVWVTLRDSGLTFPVQEFLQVWWLRETFIDGAYEKVGCPLQRGWCVVDIGAATGDFAIFASRVRGAARVVAVEAGSDAFELMKSAIAANGISGVTPRHLAIDDLDGTVYMDPDSFVISRNPTARSLSVPAMRLSRLMDSEGIEVCDLLKLDCEGAEFPILFGLQASDFTRLPRIVMETHEGPGRALPDLIGLLESHGYRVATTPHPVHPSLGYLFAQHTGPS